MSQNVSSAAVVIGALRVNFIIYFFITCCFFMCAFVVVFVCLFSACFKPHLCMWLHVLFLF